MDDLGKVRRTDFFFAFADQNKIYRQLFSGRFKSMQRAEKGGFRALLVYRTATDADFSESFFFYNSALERWRRPLRRIELFHVVHKINADAGRRAAIKKAEYPWLACSRHNLDVLEA